MRFHDENLARQAQQHELVPTGDFVRAEDARVYRMHRKAYEEARDVVAGKEVLEIGCNVGYGAAILAERAAFVTGIDVSEKAVREARRRVALKNASFSVTDGRALPFDDSAFDVVVGFQLIEHLTDCSTFLSEVTRVLRPTGCCLLTTPNARIRLDPGMKPWNVYHVQEFTAAELSQLLGEWFQEVSIRGLFGSAEFHEAEIRRVDAARRAYHNPLRAALLRSLKLHLPETSIRWLVNLRARLMGRFDAAPPTARFSLDDLSYRDTSLDESLDLMAVCRAPLPRQTKR